jgi:uncharacterized protein (DUF1800 family)
MPMNCAVAGIEPYLPTTAMPWNQQRAVHLYRRMAFGAPVETIAAALAQAPTAVVEQLIQDALSTPLSPEPEFANKVRSEYGLAVLQSTLEKDGWARDWIMALQGNGLRGRLALFWHNHFVTRFDVYLSASYMYQYHKLLQQYALGNFKDFVRQIGLTPAMLVFLNGTENIAASPNENYAREVYELFTLGVDNGYTQTDIQETARALTGYTNITVPWGPIEFDPSQHDNGQKTIFGRTGNWGYEEVIDILFEERGPQIASFIAAKLYRRFVNPDPNEAIIAELATIFRNSNWEISALVRALFQSAHFFDEENLATLIEGHLEHSLICHNEFNGTINGLAVLGIYADTTRYGQALFNPVDVAGWPGNRAWINTTNIIYRWNTIESLIGLTTFFGFAYFAQWVPQITAETQDVETICRDIIHYFLPKGFQFAEDYEAALVSFKGEIPQNYFEDGTWDVNYWAMPFQLAGLFRFLNRIPEFQLK